MAIQCDKFEKEQTMGERSQATETRQHPPVVQQLGMIITECDTPDGIGTCRDMKKGILVLGARRGSAAVRGGVVTGDIICEVNGVRVGTIRELERRLADHDPTVPVRLLIWSGGIWRFLAVPLLEGRNMGMPAPSLSLGQVLSMQ